MRGSIRRRSGGREFVRIGGQPEVEEDLLDGVVIADEGQQAARSGEVDADQGVDRKDPFEELRPQVVRSASRPLSLGVGDGAEVGPGRPVRDGIRFGGGLGRR